MLLNEILNQNLLEDFGNLKFIDSKFVNALKITDSHDVPSDTEHGFKRTTRYSTPKKLGENSQITKMPFKSAGLPATLLADAHNLGMVVCINDDQIAIIMRVPFKSDSVFTLGLDNDLISDLLDEDTSTDEKTESKNSIIDDLGNIFGHTEKGERGNRYNKWTSTSTKRIAAHLLDLDIRRDCSKAQLAQVTSVLLKAIKAKGLNSVATLHVISPDEERQKEQLKRYDQRRGYTPQKMDAKQIKNFKDAAASDLRNRLDAFKSSKAVGVDTVEELILAIREKGFLDKLKIAGFAYDLVDSSIRMEYLKNPTRYDHSYIRYQINQSSKEYDAWTNEWLNVRKLAREDPTTIPAAEEFEKTRPVRSVTVILGLDKGSIIPVSIKPNEGY